MRILILGGSGMLGHELLRAYRENHEVRVTLQRRPEDYPAAGLFTPENSISGVNARSMETLDAIMREFSPEVVINAVGIVKQREAASAYIPCIEINALLPHKLSELCGKAGARLVHFSTDCVFSGNKGNYREDDFADADDLYGRTKYLGEVHDGNCITLRSSIIGLELQRRQSLIEWFLAQTGKIKGYRRAIYTGLTTMEMARVIEHLLLRYPMLSGLYHVASSPISKYDLLSELARQLKRTDITIAADDEFVCDRSLNAERFMQATGYVAPAWDSMLAELAERIKSREEGETI